MNVQRTSVHGQCYCGAIHFEIIFPTISCSHCHCEDCRRSHGAPFVTWVELPRAQFRILAGEAKLRKHESHPGIRWGFCGECGTSFLYESDEVPANLDVTVAALTGDLDRRPECHFSTEESPDWLKDAAAIPRYRAKDRTAPT